MIKRTILFFSLVMFLPVIIYADTYWGGALPNISDTKLKVEVTLDGDIYIYSYTIISSPTNTGEIWSFNIDIKQPQDGIKLSREGLVNGHGYAKHTSTQILSEPATPKMVPVGLWSPPNWISGLTVFGQAGWNSRDAKYRIYSGQSLSNFLITSRGLPGLRDFMIQPKLIPPSAHETDLTPEESLAMVKDVKDKVSFKGKTIGPTAPPADFKPIEFLNYIISLKHEVYNLGWIVQGGDDDKGKKEDEQKGIIKSLDKKLEKAKAELVKGDTREAIEKLKSFIHEVEALYKKDKEEKHKKEEEHSHITSEAYALLKYNAIYLIEQLGGEWKDKNDKKD